MDFTSFLRAVSGMESSFGTDPRMTGNPYGMTPAAGNVTPLQLAQQNFEHLRRGLGTNPTDFQQYVAWQQGARGAMNLFNADPNSPAASIVPLSHLTGNVSSNMDASSLTTGQFLDFLSGKWLRSGGTTGNDGSTSSTASTVADAVLGAFNPLGGAKFLLGQSGASDWIANYFIRAVVIILGFIFITIGLRGLISSGGESAPAQRIITTTEEEERKRRRGLVRRVYEEKVTAKPKAERQFITIPPPPKERKTPVKRAAAKPSYKITPNEAPTSWAPKPKSKEKPPEHTKGPTIEMDVKGGIKKVVDKFGKTVRKPRTKKKEE